MHKHDVFDGGAELLMDRLSAAAESIGKALSESLRTHGEGQALLQVKVSLSVHWEGTRDVSDQVRARSRIIQSVIPDARSIDHVVNDSRKGVYCLLTGLSSNISATQFSIIMAFNFLLYNRLAILMFCSCFYPR